MTGPAGGSGSLRTPPPRLAGAAPCRSWQILADPLPFAAYRRNYRSQML